MAGRRFHPALVPGALLLTLAPLCLSAQASALWGGDGSAWTAESRLPDFSFAGYGRGERPLPEVPVAATLPVPEGGEADITAALRHAVATSPPGAILIPPGRYLVTDIIEIGRSGMVLRGADDGKTVLCFQKPLNEIKPNWTTNTSGRRTSNYSWSGGFLWIRGSFQSKRLAAVTAGAFRGARRLQVDSPEHLQPGREIEIHQTDTAENTLAVHLYSDDPGPIENLNGRARTSLIARIAKVEGDWIEIDRPLRTDVRLEWSPEIRTFEPSVAECGIENLSIEFPEIPYGGHFTELGYNAIAISGAAHCWVRNVRILNGDSGLFVSGAFNTVQGLVIESNRKPDRTRCTGHHGVLLGGTDNLLAGFDIRTRYIHDLTVSAFCSGNVFSGGRAVDLCLDHHRRAPYENLFTDLDAGAGTRLWRCGGGAGLGKHSGARGTFWNIRARRPLPPPPASFGPASLNLVGIHTAAPASTEPDGRWFEPLPPASLSPPNLHEAQLRRRLDGQAR